MPGATAERVRALGLLARHPDGCAETLMLARGFTVAFLAGLVRDRFATVELNAAQVVWVEITDLGRELLARSVSGPPGLARLAFAPKVAGDGRGQASRAQPLAMRFCGAHFR